MKEEGNTTSRALSHSFLKNCGKTHIKFTILAILNWLNLGGIKYIHNVGQLSAEANFRIISFPPKSTLCSFRSHSSLPLS